MLKKTSSFLSQDFFSPAIKALKNGELIAFLTDTVPGLAVDAFNEKAVEALYDLKGRDRSKKLVWMSDKWDKVSNHLSYDRRSYELSRQLWPGPVTIIWKAIWKPPERGTKMTKEAVNNLEKKPEKSPEKNAEKNSTDRANLSLAGNEVEKQVEKQAVRIPKDDYLLNFFSHYPSPLAVTSANESGKKEAKSLAEVKNIFGDQISFYLEHQVESSGVPSAVIDVSEGELKILRQGEKKAMQKVIEVAKKLGYKLNDG